MKSLSICTVLLLAAICDAQQSREPKSDKTPYVVVLGVAQDGGYPQAGCNKDCCKAVKIPQLVSCLAIVDPTSQQRWVIDCTPSFPQQLALLDKVTRPQFGKQNSRVDGVLLTHAHIGHYAGLIHLGREVIGSKGTPVFAMPRMETFLKSNGPWSQLVKLENIRIRAIQAKKPFRLNDRLQVTAIRVPHRDEFSETVAFQIQGPNRSILFLPDIDKWERWEEPIEDWIKKVDVAYLDGTFFNDDELPGRDMSQIPHPFIIESIKRFRRLPLKERQKIRFIHLNHTNAALRPDSQAARLVQESGHAVAKQMEKHEL